MYSNIDVFYMLSGVTQQAISCIQQPTLKHMMIETAIDFRIKPRCSKVIYNQVNSPHEHLGIVHCTHRTIP